MKLLNIGFGNYVIPARVVAVISYDSSPIKRLISEAKEKGLLIDASFGRKTNSVIITDSGHILLSAMACDGLAEKISEVNDGGVIGRDE